MSNHYEQWNKLAPQGLLLIGAGISLIGDSIIRKQQNRRWFLLGSLGIVFFNIGLAMFGESVKHRALYEAKEKS